MGYFDDPTRCPRCGGETDGFSARNACRCPVVDAPPPPVMRYDPPLEDPHRRYAALLEARRLEGMGLGRELEQATARVERLKRELAAANLAAANLYAKVQAAKTAAENNEAFVCPRCFRWYPVWADRAREFKCICGGTAERRTPPQEGE